MCDLCFATNMCYRGADSSPGWRCGLSNGSMVMGSSIDTWAGVTTASAGGVQWAIAIDLFDYRYGGSLPSSIGRLTNLTYIRIWQHYLRGTLPSQIGSLVHLQELNFYSSYMTGSMPVSICNLTDLARIDLSFNSLTGPLPANFTLLTKLQGLMLGSTKLKGVISESVLLTGLPLLDAVDVSGLNTVDGYAVPSWIAYMTKLTYLSFRNNRVPGSFPELLWHLSNLRYLDLSGNSIAGRLPAWLYGRTNMQQLRMNGNRLTGPIPDTFPNMSSLQYLHLTRNSLSGTIPSNLADITSLQSLYFAVNCIVGTLPSSLARMTKLQVFAANGNQLTGTLPSWLSSWTNIATFYVHRNSLNGTIPQIFGSWTNLLYLDLSVNCFYGSVPSTIGSASNMRNFVLFQNSLDSIPSSFGSLASLSFLDISFNCFGAFVPEAFSDLRNMAFLRINNNRFSGNIPTFIGANFGGLQLLSIGSNLFTGGVPSNIYNLQGLSNFSFHHNMLSGSLLDLSQASAPALTYFYGGYNMFTGTLPKQLLARTQIIDFDMTSNQLTGTIPSLIGSANRLQRFAVSLNTLTGPIPSEIGQCSQLTTLELHSNVLTNSLPAGIDQFTNLRNLSFSDNQISGTFPSLMGNLALLRDLNGANNAMTGTLPPSISLFTALERLDLTNNKLNGPLPNTMFSGLQQLTSLQLRSNLFSGTLPSNIGSASKLTAIDIGNAAFSGMIPTSIGCLSLLDSLKMNHNSFTGVSTTSLCSLSRLKVLVISNNQLTGSIDLSCLNSTAITTAPQRSKAPSMVPTFSPTLNVSSPPYVTFEIISTGSTYVDISIDFSYPGLATCAVLDATLVRPYEQLIRIQGKTFVADIGGALQGNLTLNGLLPLSRYSLYCLPMSFSGSTGAIDIVWASKKQVNTSCCSSIEVRVLRQYLYTETFNQGVLSIVSANALQEPVTINITVSYTAPQSQSSMVINSSRVFHPASRVTNLVKPLYIDMLPQSNPGNYTFAVYVIDNRGAIYSITEFPLGNVFEVISRDIGGLPKMSAARFIDDGRYFEVIFDRVTDGARLPSPFTCTSLFFFHGAGSAVCSWSRNSDRVLTDPRGSNISVGAEIGLIPSVLRAECASQNEPSCLNYDTAPSSTVLLSPPLSPAAPVVVVVAPNVVSKCDGILIDLTGSSGSGGRAWDSVLFSVSSRHEDSAGRIEAFLNTAFSVYPPSRVSKDLLQSGETYFVTVELCNFLKACSQKVFSFSVSQSAIPTVVIYGSDPRIVRRSEKVRLEAAAYLPGCNGQSSNLNLRYVWALQVLQASGTFASSGLASESRDPQIFLLPENVLTAGLTYRANVEVFHDATSVSSKAQVDLNVESGSIIATLSNPREFSAGIASTFTLDATKSYDEDTVESGISGLRFSWSCIVLHSNVAISCDSIVRATVINSGQLYVATLDDAVNSTLFYTLLVCDATGLRSSSVSTTVHVLGDIVPVLDILEFDLSPNLDTKFAIEAQVATSLPGRIAWNVDKPVNGDLADDVLTVTSRFVTTSELLAVGGMKRFRFDFVLKSNALHGCEEYTFSLKYFDTLNNVVAFASFGVTPNAPPAPGTFNVSPLIGTALMTVFNCTAGYWTDVDIPIQYEFSFLIGRDFTVFRSFSEKSDTSSAFPRGDALRGGLLTLRVAVADSLLAQSFADSSIMLSGAQSSSISNIQNISALRENADEGVLTSALATNLAILNSANCTIAPNCTALYREACFDVSHTCGPCLDGFSGVSGSSNIACTAGAAGAIALSKMALECPGGCSGHGQCAWIPRCHIGDNSPRLDECDIADDHCKAICFCDSGYAGSACSMTTAELSLRQQIRGELLQLIGDLIQRNNMSPVALSAWTTFLKQTVTQESELSNEDKIATANIIRDFLVWAGANNLPMEYLTGIIDVIGTLSWSNDCIVESGLHSHEEWIQSYNHSIAAQLANQTTLLQLYADSVLRNVFTANEVSFVDAKAFKSTFSVLDIYENSSLVGPQSSLDMMISRSSPTLQFKGLNPRTQANVSTMGTWLVQTKSEALLNPQLLGDSIQAHFTGNPCEHMTNADACTVLVTLPFSPKDLIKPEDVVATEVIEVSCRGPVVSNATETCANGYNVSVECNGSWTGMVRLPCPELVAMPTCNGLRGRDGVDLGCVTVAYTGSNVTCRCPALHEVARVLGRKVSSTSSPQFVPMLTYTAVQFAATWSTADDLNAKTVQESLIALMLLCAVAVCGLGFGGFGFWLDKRQRARDGKSKAVTVSVEASIANSETNIVGDLKNMVMNALPSAFLDKWWVVQFVIEIKKNHKWFGVVFSYSEVIPRHVRALTLTGYVLFVMFGNAVMFQLTLPDDDSCAKHTSEESCVSEYSPLTKESKCYWAESENTCQFRNFESSIWVIMYIVIISAIITLPLTLAQDYLVSRVILAPVRSSKTSVDRRPSQAKLSAIASDSYLLQISKTLFRELWSYRSLLTADSQLEFDRMWGDIKLMENRPPRNLLSDLKSAAAMAEEEENNFSKLTTVAEREARMLSLFQRDLLPFTAGAVVHSKVAREVERPPDSVLLITKIMAWVYLAVSNLGILFYIYLFAIQQSHTRQRQWLAAFVVWVATDMILLSTVLTYMTCMYVPSLFVQDVKDARAQVLDTLDSQSDVVNKHKYHVPFNACLYFFVSHRLAALHPELQSSKIILQYSSPWPRRSYWSAFSLRAALAFGLVRFLEGLFDMPDAIQDLIARFMVTLFAANIVLTDSLLSQFGPLLHFLFILVMVAVIYAISKAIQVVLRATTAQEMKSRNGTVLHEYAQSALPFSKRQQQQEGASNAPTTVATNTRVHPKLALGAQLVLPRRRQSAVEGLEAAERLETIVRAAELKEIPDAAHKESNDMKFVAEGGGFVSHENEEEFEDDEYSYAMTVSSDGSSDQASDATLTGAALYALPISSDSD